jgi:translation initiation factor 1A
MTKINEKGGKKFKRGKKIEEDHEHYPDISSDNHFSYALVIKKLGGRYLEVQTYKGPHKKAFIRGSFQKKIWINVGDIILVSSRDFEDNVCDIIYKYSPQNVRSLINKNQIDLSFANNLISINDDDICFQSDDVEIDSI